MHPLEHTHTHSPVAINVRHVGSLCWGVYSSVAVAVVICVGNVLEVIMTGM